MTLPPDLELRAPEPGEEAAIAELVRACDESYREWTPPGWEPPPVGRELDRWRGRLMDEGWWTRVAVEPGGRVVGLICFAQALAWAADEPPAGAPIPGRAPVSAVVTHPERWRPGVGAAMLANAQDAMRAAGYREVQLWTPRDAPARHFYEATGWRHDGREQWLAELSLPIVAYVREL